MIWSIVVRRWFFYCLGHFGYILDVLKSHMCLERAVLCSFFFFFFTVKRCFVWVAPLLPEAIFYSYIYISGKNECNIRFSRQHCYCSRIILWVILIFFFQVIRIVFVIFLCSSEIKTILDLFYLVSKKYPQKIWNGVSFVVSHCLRKIVGYIFKIGDLLLMRREFFMITLNTAVSESVKITD